MRSRALLVALGAITLPIAITATSSAATLNTWSPTGALSSGRLDASIATLTNGKVLFVGGNAGTLGVPVPSSAADLYDPASGTWSSTGGAGLSTARYDATASAIANNQVLVSGGITGTATSPSIATSAEIYDATSAGFSTVAVTPPVAEFDAAAVTLSNGTVFIVGGDTGTPTAPVAATSYMIYNPQGATWSLGTAPAFGASPTATVLSNGMVLIAGGNANTGAEELYNPATASFSPAGQLATNRSNATAALLSTGSVLVAGGYSLGNSPTALASAELYSPTSNSWSTAGSLPGAAGSATAIALANGQALFAGGNSATPSAPVPTAAAALYTASSNTWAATTSMATARSDASAVGLASGLVLEAGGLSTTGPTANAETYLAGGIPTFTSAATATFPIGKITTFPITVSGSPTPTVAETGALPAGVQFATNTTGQQLIGSPTSGAGSFPITLTASNGIGSATQNLVITVTKTSATGYLVAGKSANVNAFGSAKPGALVVVNPTVKPVVAIAASPGSAGYYLVTSVGNVFNEAGAPFFGSKAAAHLASPIAAFATTPDGKGYWLVAKSGTVYAFGDATAMSSLTVNVKIRPIVAMASSADGKGYYLVTSLGNVYNYGDAPFFGSKAATRLPHPVVAFALSNDARGYYVVTSGGNVYNLGDAKFFGSKAATKLVTPIVAFAPTSDGGGYYLVSSGGNVFNLGDGPFFGSAAALKLPAAIVGIDLIG